MGGPDLLSQLDGIELKQSAINPFEAALSIDPLDLDSWWELTSQEGGVVEFLQRIRNLDFTDQRANILFSRRMERLLAYGYEDEYLELTRKLLAQRPSNQRGQKWGNYNKGNKFDHVVLL